MPTLSVRLLKQFEDKCSKIPNDLIIPINASLLFDFKDNTCCITKNGSQSFIRECFEAEGEGRILVDEKSLFNFVKNNKGPMINIDQNGKTVKLSIGEAVDYSPTYDASNFFENDLPDGDGVEIDSTLVLEIKTAGKFIITEDTPTPRSFVFVGCGYVAGTDAVVGYWSQNDLDVKWVFRKEVVDAIPALGGTYHSSDNYDFFVSGDCIIGFKKSEFPFTDTSKYAQYDDSKSFTFSKADLISFNEWAIGGTVSKGVTSTWKIESDHIIFESQDPNYVKGKTKKFNYAGGCTGSFSYLSVAMIKLLKNISEDNLILYQEGEGDRYYVTDTDKTFTSLIMKIL